MALHGTGKSLYSTSLTMSNHEVALDNHDARHEQGVSYPRAVAALAPGLPYIITVQQGVITHSTDNRLRGGWYLLVATLNL
jgi:hypothetical protein